MADAILTVDEARSFRDQSQIPSGEEEYHQVATTRDSYLEKEPEKPLERLDTVRNRYLKEQ